MELSDLSREQLLTLLEVYARQLITCDSYWFTAVEERFGLETAVEMENWVWERVGPLEGKRVARALGLDPGEGIATILEIMKFCPSWATFSPRVEMVGEKKGVFTCTNCPIQKKRTERGMAQFECKEMADRLAKAFVQGLNPKVKASCVVAPPDPHTADVWCQYELRE